MGGVKRPLERRGVSREGPRSDIGEGVGRLAVVGPGRPVPSQESRRRGGGLGGRVVGALRTKSREGLPVPDQKDTRVSGPQIHGKLLTELGGAFLLRLFDVGVYTGHGQTNPVTCCSE